MSKVYVNRQGEIISRSEWLRKRSDLNYINLRVFQNSGYMVRCWWWGQVDESNPRGEWEPFKVDVSTVASVLDPPAAKTVLINKALQPDFRSRALKLYKSESDAIEGYAQALCDKELGSLDYNLSLDKVIVTEFENMMSEKYGNGDPETGFVFIKRGEVFNLDEHLKTIFVEKNHHSNPLHSSW